MAAIRLFCRSSWRCCRAVAGKAAGWEAFSGVEETLAGQTAGLNGGLGGLIDMFTQVGQGETAKSWISSGPNRSIAPQDVEKAFGGQTIDNLSQQTGLQRNDLLAQLSAILPEAVDRLTPKGRMPEEHETRDW